jgi:hypothetical protein
MTHIDILKAILATGVLDPYSSAQFLEATGH